MWWACGVRVYRVRGVHVGGGASSKGDSDELQKLHAKKIAQGSSRSSASPRERETHAARRTLLTHTLVTRPPHSPTAPAYHSFAFGLPSARSAASFCARAARPVSLSLPDM